VARRYEKVCGLEDGSLVAAIDLVYRHDQPVCGHAFLRRPLPEDPIGDAEALLERALGQEPMRRQDWDELSALLGEHPAVVLRRDDWKQLVRRGLHEMEVSAGLEYLQRAEAMARIAGHPRAGRWVVELVGETLADPQAQVYSESAALLQCCGHPDSAAAVLEVVRAPVSVHALRAALFASSMLVRQRRFPRPLLVELAGRALDYCGDAVLPHRVRRAAADVLLALTPSARRRIAADLHRRPAELNVISVLLGEGRRPREELRALRQRIRQRIGSLGSRDLLEEEPLLSLLDYLTVESNHERHGHALVLMMLLPFGPTVGCAYAAELAECLDAQEAPRAHDCLDVLRCLATGDEADLLVEVATRDRTVAGEETGLAVEACWALGNLKFAARHVEFAEEQVAGAVRAALDGSRPAPGVLLEAWAYALGMRGRTDLLGALPDGAGADEPERAEGAGTAGEAWRAARRYWLDVPDHLRPVAGGSHRPLHGASRRPTNPPVVDRSRA
jgi:hypothetical protein